jgi:hypothetical protein
MGGLKTFLLGLTLGHLPAPALSGDDLARVFAQCSGRLSALMEHQFITDGPASDATRADRDRMVELLETVAQPGPQAMQWRLSAKFAQAELLAQWRAHPQDHRLAQRATTLIDDCRALIGPQS